MRSGGGRPGEPALAAFGRFVRRTRGSLAEPDPQARERLAAVTRMIAESPALLAREQRIYESYTTALAALLAEETGARERRRVSRGWPPTR